MSHDNKLSLNKQLEVLSLSKGRYYYEPKGESEYNETIMKEIDRIHTDNPARGVLGTVLDLVALNFIAGPKRVRRLMGRCESSPCGRDAISLMVQTPSS